MNQDEIKINKNVGEPTDEMLNIFRSSYCGNKQDLEKAISALKEYGCFQVMTIKIIMLELKIGLYEARCLFDTSKVLG